MWRLLVASLVVAASADGVEVGVPQRDSNVSQEKFTADLSEQIF